MSRASRKSSDPSGKGTPASRNTFRLPDLLPRWASSGSAPFRGRPSNTASRRSSRVALKTQLDSESAIRSFTKDLALVSDTLVANDENLRTVIDNGAIAARDVRQLIEDNEDDLAVLINNLVTTNQIVSARVDGIEQVLVLYPYVVEGGYTIHQPSGERMSIYDAAQRYQADGVPLVVFAGVEYGNGSSRDWAAKGTNLLGVKAVVAQWKCLRRCASSTRSSRAQAL